MILPRPGQLHHANHGTHLERSKPEPTLAGPVLLDGGYTSTSTSQGRLCEAKPTPSATYGLQASQPAVSDSQVWNQFV